jgi:2-iminobutanoate/2-iminopropanoate deaminase
VWAGHTLYLSGLTGFQPATGNVVAGLDKQMHQMGANHMTVLESAGLKLDDIVNGFVYLADMEDYAPMNAIYKEYYSRGPGVRTTLMPTRMDMKDVRVQASFIAARTQATGAASK